MRAVDGTFEQFRQSFEAAVKAKDWFGAYLMSFSWDEERFMYEMLPGEADLNFDQRFWTRKDGWERHEARDKSSVNYVRTAGPSPLWKHLTYFEYSYLRLTPHTFWWGRNAEWNGQTMHLIPPERVTWRKLEANHFGGEMCDVVDSIRRKERLWIGQGSKRLRAVLSYGVNQGPAKSIKFYETDAIRRIAGKSFGSQRDYSNWSLGEATEQQSIDIALAWAEYEGDPIDPKIEPNELAMFDDYREVAPGVWLPFEEVRVFRHASDEVPHEHKLLRSELHVEQVRTDQVLADRFSSLLPKDGDQIQDQRFQVPVDFEFRADRSDDEIRKRAEAEYTKRLEGQEIVKRLVQPIQDLVGKPASPLPAEGWVGEPADDLAGKPYLLHFWATWCGPCKNDLPMLRSLHERGVKIVGMHPSGTTAAEVEKAMRDDQFIHPTFLESANVGDSFRPRIGGYPTGVYPYYILVDAKGLVAGHGHLIELMKQLGMRSLIGEKSEKPASR